MNDAKISLHSRRRSELQRTLQALPHLLDREVGLIHSIEWHPVRYDDPKFVHCIATLGDISRFTGRACNRVTGGTALTEDAALAKAIGESVERYCGDLYDPTEIQFVPYREVRSRATDPRRFVLFHPDQYRSSDFPFAPVTEDSVIGWVKGFSLTRSEPTLVPAAMVYVPYDHHTPAEHFELGPVSGYACGNTLEEAILGGIYEVVERDAFMIFWYNWLPVPTIDLFSAASPEIKQTLDRYHSAPIRLYCANITTDVGIPAILTVMTSQQRRWPAAVVATAADLDPEQAITHALLELSANHLSVRWHLEARFRHRPRTLQDIVEPEDHGLLYTYPHMLPYLDPVLRPRGVVRIRDLPSCAAEDLKENIEFCVRQLAQLDLEVIVVDLTSADVEELGFKVVKVLVPGMQPLDFGVRWLHLGGRRIYEVPRRMGYRRFNTQPWELNLFPHPFP
jgi:ribosomal protein S12 methylthiotransferase accessory factor